MGTGGANHSMTVFEHYVVDLATHHMAVLRAQRSLGPNPTRAEDQAVSNLTCALIRRMHRLATLRAEMGEGAVFGTPKQALGMDEVRRLFPVDV